MKTVPTYRWLAYLLVMAVTVSAQTPQEKGAHGKSTDDVTMTAQLVKTGLYLISGGGSNTLLRLSPGALILVDGKLPDNYRALMSQVRKISRITDLPIGALIVTNHHQNHTGANEKFLAAKVQIVAQENAKTNMAACAPAGRKAALPTFTYNREFSIKVGGVEVQLRHYGAAYTNGDTVVYFPNLKVVAVGDLFTPNTPDPDFSSGGSLVNWGLALAQILQLDFDVVVPSTGPMVARANLVAFKIRMDTLVSRATELVKKGVAKDQLMAQLKTDDLGWRFNFTGDQLDRFYNELSQTK